MCRIRDVDETGLLLSGRPIDKDPGSTREQLQLLLSCASVDSRGPTDLTP